MGARISGVLPRQTLRAYLIAVFVPLAGLPLVALAVLTYVFVTRAIDQEIVRRARPELAAVARNLETAEKRLERQMTTLARGDEFRVSLLGRDDAGLGREARTWLEASLFESVRIFNAEGALAAQYQRASVNEAGNWEGVFGVKSNAAGRRGPSSVKSTLAASFSDDASRFEESGRSALRAEFRKFLRAEDGWILRSVDRTGRGLAWTFYKIVFDSDYKTAGFLEGSVTLTPARLRVLADFQGVDLAIVPPALDWVAGSDGEVTTAFSRWLPEFKATGRASDLRDLSADVRVRGTSTAFFFTPVANDAGGPVAWISVGLSKDDQLAFRNTILLWVSLMAAGLAALVAYITVLVSRRITRPISELVQAAERVRRGEWVEPVESADTRSEIGFLVKRFNDMALGVQVTKRTLETKLEELARAHNELTLTQGQLVQSAKMGSLGQLVAGVAHELNNPIAFIYSNMSQMRGYLRNLDEMDRLVRELREKATPEDRARVEKALEELEWDYLRKDMKEIVQSCLEGSIRVKDIVLGLRNFSRADKGDVAEVDINQALENTAKLLVGQIKNRVELHWNLCSNGLLRCNLVQVNQVLMNLMANALQAIEGRGNVWVDSRVEGEGELEEMVVTIRDDGKGIPADQIDRIFDPFFTTKKVGEGTGLGLSIVYGIVERHRGSLHVKSTTADVDPRGHGTEFTVRLPRRGPSLPAADVDSDRRSA